MGSQIYQKEGHHSGGLQVLCCEDEQARQNNNRDSTLDVGPGTHFNMEAQLGLNFVRDLIGMSPSMKKSKYGLDPGHSV